MPKFNKKKSGELPAVSTAALPDIVFMLLFFFMTVTTFKKKSPPVAQTLPKADQVQTLDTKQNDVVFIYMGKPHSKYNIGTQPKIYFNDKFVDVADLNINWLAQVEKAGAQQNKVTTALKVDGETNMGIIGDVKQELRKINALKISYTVKKGDVNDNFK